MIEWWRSHSEVQKTETPSSYLEEDDELELIKMIALSDPVLDWPVEDRCKRVRKNVMDAIAQEPAPSSRFRLGKFL